MTDESIRNAPQHTFRFNSTIVQEMQNTFAEAAAQTVLFNRDNQLRALRLIENQLFIQWLYESRVDNAGAYALAH